MQVYSADLVRLKAAVGSKDAALFEAVTALWPSDPASGSDDGDLSDRAALRVLIDGGPFDRDYSQRYLDALEAICRHIGEHVDDFSFHHGGFEELDEEFGVPEGLSIEDFRFAWSDDFFPYLESGGGGYWKHAECIAALSEREEDDPEEYEDVHETPLEDLTGVDLWLMVAKRTGKDIVTFWGV